MLDLDVVLAAKDFPSSPKAALRAARAADHEVYATYAVGPWMAANFLTVLEESCHTVAIWVIRADAARMRALWLRRTSPTGPKWQFHAAWQVMPDVRALKSNEMRDWING